MCDLESVPDSIFIPDVFVLFLFLFHGLPHYERCSIDYRRYGKRSCQRMIKLFGTPRQMFEGRVRDFENGSL